LTRHLSKTFDYADLLKLTEIFIVSFLFSVYNY
jgi:hypothetical protein